MSAIELEDLTKVYASGVTAVDRLTLDVADGEFVVLVGPSGCGKTTALRMVAGLEPVTSGTVSIRGQVVNDVSPRRRDIAMVFQNYALYPHLTVYDNIGFALENAGVPKAERDRRIRAAAASIGLSELLRRKPRQLSGGQRQRVAMGRAIVRDPAVFLMDEPLSNLDAKLRVWMRAEVLRVHRSIGAATLYVTHDQVEAMTMGDRIAVLSAGTLQQYGPPQELYTRPVNLFVARFIGSPEMNLYEAAVDESGALVLGSQRIDLGQLPQAAMSAVIPGQPVIVGIRPEDLALCPDGTPGALVAGVRAVERLGSELHAFLAIDARPAGTGPRLAAADADAGVPGAAHNGVARLGPRAPVRPGGRVTLRVDPARLYFFDPVTGQAAGWPASHPTPAPALPPAPRLTVRLPLIYAAATGSRQPGGRSAGPGSRELTGSAVEVVPPMVESGTELAGRYRLDRRLGTGGMGEVWQARDLKFERDLDLRRDVAIKLMHSTLTEGDMLRRFQLEAKILSRLDHPHIVRMLDADWHQGQLFIVMELLADQDLGRLLSGHPHGLPVHRAVELARQLAAGLSVVHQRGIVHRDLKPANLFVQPGDLLKIGDFGIARDNSASSVLTAHGVIMGTWAYIAPERWLGTWNGEPATDLYSAGCILYELLTGQTPFTADSMAIIRMHCEEAPRPPRARNRDIPEPLDRLVLRLLAKDPAARPATAADVEAELAQVRDALARAAGTRPWPADAQWNGTKWDGAARPPAAGQAPAPGRNPPNPASPNPASPSLAQPALVGPGRAGVTAPLACLSLSPDHRHFFVLAGARSLKHRTYWPSQAWYTWHDMRPLPPGDAAAVAAQAYGDHQKMAVAAGGAVYHRWRVGNPGGGWSPWDALPPLGAPVTDLALAAVAAGHWDVFALGADQAVRRSSWRDGGEAAGWSRWLDVPAPEGRPVTAVAASCASSHDQDGDRVEEHRQDLVVVADGRVWHRSRRGAPASMPDWSGWQPLTDAAPDVTDVACSSQGPGHVEVFAVHASGRVSRRDHMERAGWSGWQDLPAPAGQRVAAITSTSCPFSPYQKLAVLTPVGQVYHAWRSAFGPGGESGWTPWRDLPVLRPR
jgi:multiple sugar transport system ATP-binding protein